MQVKLLVSRSGCDFAQSAGETITVDDAEGLRMIKAGQADAVKVKETATRKQTTQKRSK